MKAKKKNPESVALDRKTIDFIAPASLYNGVVKPLKQEAPKETSTGIANQVVSTIPTQEVQAAPQTTSENELEEKFEKTIEPEIEETSAVLVSEPKQEIKVEPKPTEPIAAEKIEIKMPEKRVSGLSISSLRAKKEHELSKKDITIDESQLPNDDIIESVMQGHWADFVQKIDDDGRKILASNLHSDIPKLVDKIILSIQLPNDTMKKEVEREQYDLIEYLKLKLNNHFISLKITVNEEAAKKFAFTPEEKYEKLREKNPVIDLLRKEFDLDL